MSLFGSFFGAVVALPLAILAANNVTNNRFVNLIVRFSLTVLRTLPTLVAALIATYIFGLGTFAGTVAIFMFSLSFVGKQLFEYIETVDMGAYEALIATGANAPRAFVTAIMPQILPTYLSTSLFAFEGNVRYAAILGYVGAGGIGWRIGWNILEGIVTPDKDLLFGGGDSGVAYLILQTIAIAFLGTLVGAIIAVPLSFISATNIVPKPVVVVTRFVIMAIRTVPSLVYGLMFIRVTGPGPFAGVMTLAVVSI
ncbi:hypothetical protein Pfo_031224, partial [Paulownia fortunei]